jgi:hypothetical protein
MGLSLHMSVLALEPLNQKGTDMAKSKPVMAVTKTQTFNSPAAALKSAKQQLANGEISKTIFDRIEKKMTGLMDKK